MFQGPKFLNFKIDWSRSGEGSKATLAPTERSGGATGPCGSYVAAAPVRYSARVFHVFTITPKVELNIVVSRGSATIGTTGLVAPTFFGEGQSNL